MKLLLDEMHAPAIAEELVRLGYDVVAVAADEMLRGTSDEDLLTEAALLGRALVTENARDLVPIATRWIVEGRSHGGLVVTNPRRFDRAGVTYPGMVISALRLFLDESPVVGDSWVWWL